MSLLKEWHRMRSFASLKFVPEFRKSRAAPSEFPSAGSAGYGNGRSGGRFLTGVEQVIDHTERFEEDAK